MIKILALFRHRPDKIRNLLPYCGMDSKFIKQRSTIRLGVNTHIHLNRRLSFTKVLNSLLLLPGYIDDKYISFIINSYKPDIIITHGGVRARHVLRKARDMGVLSVMRIGGHIYEEYRQSYGNGYSAHHEAVLDNLKYCDHIITVTQNIKDRYCTESKTASEKVSVLPVPCNVAAYDIPKASNQNVLVVSNINFIPKLKAIVDYLPSIKKYRHRIIAIGKYARQLQYLTDYYIDGSTINICKEYAVAGVVCYFSYLDGCPNVILEAWASKTPLVVNAADWNKGLIENGVTGIIVNDNHEATLAIDEVLNNKSIADKLARNGYEYVRQHHAYDSVGIELGRILRNIVND